MKKPILFSAPMVRAILAGTKTQTRRVCKPAEEEALCEIVGPFDDETGTNWFGDAEGDVKFACPYGNPGDRLWVREAWRAWASFDSTAPRNIVNGAAIQYEAGGNNIGSCNSLMNMGKYRPPMFMPRWASRILLEIVSVRVDRLQDISEADALAEGVSPDMGICWKSGDDTPRGMYGELWESINGPGSWDATPWVWVVEFKRVQP